MRQFRFSWANRNAGATQMGMEPYLARSRFVARW